ncbi:MAG: TVP38/TMEM64 family protein [Pseudomonadota bacterium]
MPRLLLLSLFTGGLLAFFLLGGDRYLSLEALQASRDRLLALAEGHFWASILIAMLLYTLAVALSIPGGLVLSLAMGLVFGRWLGTLLIVLSATVGATLVFLATRYVFGEALRQRMQGKAGRILEGFREDAFNYLLFLRLVPLFPFWLVNIAPAFTGVGLRTYVLATFIGIIPGSFVFANIGASLGRIASAEDLVSREALLALSLLGLFALLPVAAKAWKAKRTGRKAS